MTETFWKWFSMFITLQSLFYLSFICVGFWTNTKHKWVTNFPCFSWIEWLKRTQLIHSTWKWTHSIFYSNIISFVPHLNCESYLFKECQIVRVSYEVLVWLLDRKIFAGTLSICHDISVAGTSFLVFYRYQWTIYSLLEFKMLKWLFNKVRHVIVIDDIPIFILFRTEKKNKDVFTCKGNERQRRKDESN